MIGRITIQIPFLFSFAGLTWFKSRQAGFSFNNRATLILSENVNRTIDQLPKWIEENRTLYFSEMLYAAYLSHCQETYTKPKFSREKLTQGYLRLSEEDQKRIIKAWNEANSTGAKDMPVKKKHIANRGRR